MLKFAVINCYQVFSNFDNWVLIHPSVELVTAKLFYTAQGQANLQNRYSALCWRPVTHAQTWASYRALYRFGRLSQGHCEIVIVSQNWGDKYNEKSQYLMIMVKVSRSTLEQCSATSVFLEW